MVLEISSFYYGTRSGAYYVCNGIRRVFVYPRVRVERKVSCVFVCFANFEVPGGGENNGSY